MGEEDMLKRAQPWRRVDKFSFTKIGHLPRYSHAVATDARARRRRTACLRECYPYFAVRCGYCSEKPFRWTRKFSPSDLALLAKGESGRLALCRRLGCNAVPNDDFTARRDSAQIVLQGKGQGHGIGLCQRGAEAMASDERIALKS